MVDIVFNESAAGSLKQSKLTNQLLCFNLSLNIDDISEDIPGVKRKQILQELSSVYPFDIHEIVYNTSLENIDILFKTIKNQIPLRIWYSNNAEEWCGFLWLMALIKNYDKIEVIEIPLNEDERGSGDIEPEKWIDYLPNRKHLSSMQINEYSEKWNQLKTVNAPLRIVKGNAIINAEEDFYDDCIISTMYHQQETFNEAKIIGILLQNELKELSDAWIALRINKMVEQGLFEVIQEFSDGSPSYHRILKKK